jgi:head-tail adaptor
MPKYKVQLYGHTMIYRAYTAMVEVEASSEKEAQSQAEEMAMEDKIIWSGYVEDQTFDSTVDLDSAEVECEISDGEC